MDVIESILSFNPGQIAQLFTESNLAYKFLKNPKSCMSICLDRHILVQCLWCMVWKRFRAAFWKFVERSKRFVLPLFSVAPLMLLSKSLILLYIYKLWSLKYFFPLRNGKQSTCHIALEADGKSNVCFLW